MMERTDRHCRALHRLLSRHARLYTEMLTADALLHGDRARLLAFSPMEHPVALQLGGADPGKLAAVARIGADAGYDEINLNVGCPSDRVQSGCFGAALMREPDRVAECVAAIRTRVAVPVTVKCRIGVDDQNPETALDTLVALCADAGARMFVVHARKALLSGLSPKKNREVPPLDYPLVYALKARRPDLVVVLNGGIATLDEAAAHLAYVDGVMIGRAAYQNPALLAAVDARLFGGEKIDTGSAVRAYAAYVDAELAHGVPLNAMTKHMLGLFNGQPGARAFRRYLSENAAQSDASAETLRRALAFIGTGPGSCAA